MIASHSASVSAIGFSTKTCLPAFAAATAKSRCVKVGVVMTTASNCTPVERLARRRRSSGRRRSLLPRLPRSRGRCRRRRQALHRRCAARASWHGRGRRGRRRSGRCECGSGRAVIAGPIPSAMRCSRWTMLSIGGTRRWARALSRAQRLRRARRRFGQIGDKPDGVAGNERAAPRGDVGARPGAGRARRECRP